MPPEPGPESRGLWETSIPQHWDPLCSTGTGREEQGVGHIMVFCTSCSIAERENNSSEYTELVPPCGLVHRRCRPRLRLCDVEDLLPVGQGGNDFKCLGKLPAPVFGQHLQ